MKSHFAFDFDLEQIIDSGFVLTRLKRTLAALVSREGEVKLKTKQNKDKQCDKRRTFI